jgi:hypothetical protein
MKRNEEVIIAAVREREDWIPRQWLGRETSLEEIESAPYPNELWLREWREFMSQMQPGDQLRWFSSPDEAWRLLAGRAGYAIVRQGEVVDAFIIILN